MRRILLNLITLGVLGLTVRVASASPLEAVMHSPLMRTFEKQTQDTVDRTALREKLRPDSNMALIFSRRSAIKLLNAWGAPQDHKFLPGKERVDSDPQFVVAERTFTSITGQVVTVRTFVAHPHYAGVAELGLLDAFAKLTPPRLDAEYTLPITVQGTAATAYRLQSGGLALLIPVMQGVAIQLKTPRWDDLQPTLVLAERIDLGRLRLKLES